MFLLLLFWPVSVGVMASKGEVFCQCCMSFVKLRKNSHLTKQQDFWLAIVPANMLQLYSMTPMLQEFHSAMGTDFESASQIHSLISKC